MDEETPSQINKDVVKERPWRVNKLKSKTKGRNSEKCKRDNISNSTQLNNLPTTNQFSPLVDLTDDKQCNDHDETSGATNYMNKPEFEKRNNREISNRHRQGKRSKYTAVLGDSLLKGIRRDKISRSTKQRVSVGCFPGATIEDMKDYIKPTLKRKPDHIILHIGTNNCETSEILKL